MPAGQTLWLWLAVALAAPVLVHSFAEGLYCGMQNCYDVLGVTRDSTRQEISKAYRKLAIKHHPDKVRGDPEAKKEAEKAFQVIATAYETLKDDEAREDYNYMIDNPEEMYRHYYYYYKRRLSPKVDVRIVIVVTILAVSVVQYISAWHKYNEALSYLLSDSKYRHKAAAIAKEQGLINENQKRGQKRQRKEEIKEQEEAILKQIIEENIDIHGGYKRPCVWDVVAFQLLRLPLTLYEWAAFYLRWFWKFTICREEYGEDEKFYLIRRYMGLSEAQMNSMDDKDHDEYLRKELWIKSNFTEWKEEKEEKERQKLLEKGSYKRYQRYQRKGVPQMSFVDDE